MPRFSRAPSFLLVALLALVACQSATVPTPTLTVAPVVARQVDTPVPATPTGLPPTPVPPTPTVPDTATPLPPSATATPVPSSPTATAVPPTVTATSGQVTSWFDKATILGFYGRGFGVAPILGRVGGYRSIDDMAKDVDTWVAKVRAVNGGKAVIPEIHLIYALAIPCSASDDCLLYLEAMDSHLADTYIKPAQARGWQVYLDTQLGRSDPVTQVKRMIAMGYLAYDNVEVALDPEFHAYPGRLVPGIPVGTIEAQQVNDVQALLDDYVQKQHLAHRKIVVIHQFGDKAINDGVPYMIQHKSDVRDYANVDLVITADGFGSPDSKIVKYNKMTDSTTYPFVRVRGIKIFPPNPYEQAGHYDKPQLTLRELWGLDPTSGKERMQVAPDFLLVN